MPGLCQRPVALPRKRLPPTASRLVPVAILGLFMLLATRGEPAHGTARTASLGPAAPRGYWLVGADGGIFSFGDASFKGSMGGERLTKPVVGMASTPSGQGYWLASADGGVFSFGAPFRGSAGRIRLNQPIVGIAATPSGQGYWLVSSDGGIFSFGDAGFFGSTGGTRLNSPVVGMASTPSGRGYRLVASDGGIFSFGDAGFFGSTGGTHLNSPVVGMAATPSGRGYRLVASDGGIFSFGDAGFFGSTGGTRLNRPVVGMASTPSGEGYWLVASDGGIFSFGDARFLGSRGGARLASPVVGMSGVASHGSSRVSIFYYPWYGNPANDGEWRHWEQNLHFPPDDIGASFYPARGAYSSSDRPTVDAQMGEIAAAGIDDVVVSWWGRGSFEDRQLPAIRQAAQARGLGIASLIEPYRGRTVRGVEQDIAYLRSLGINDFYVYDSLRLPISEWADANRRLQGVRVFAQTTEVAKVKGGEAVHLARAGGFEGIFTYDPYAFQPADFARACARARAEELVCIPSVSPGYDASRATLDLRIRDRAGGSVYDSLWQGAIDASADIVSIASYNEWHEGTQIEPARDMCLPQGFCYRTYSGSYGLVAEAARTVYLDRTAYWAARYRTSRGG